MPNTYNVGPDAGMYLTIQDAIADINLRITVQDLEELSRVLGRIQGLPNILSARRKA